MNEHSSGVTLGSMISTIFALLIIAFGLVMLTRVYWTWYAKNFAKTKHKPTLFDVREHVGRGEKGIAVKLYRKIFNVSAKEAQSAVDELEKSMHQQG